MDQQGPAIAQFSGTAVLYLGLDVVVKRQLETLSGVDRAVVQAFGFERVKVRLPTSGRSVIGSLAPRDTLLRQTVFGFGLRSFIVSLHSRGARGISAQVSCTPEAKEALDLWVRLAKERIPDIHVILEN